MIVALTQNACRGWRSNQLASIRTLAVSWQWIESVPPQVCRGHVVSASFSTRTRILHFAYWLLSDGLTQRVFHQFHSSCAAFVDPDRMVYILDSSALNIAQKVEVDAVPSFISVLGLYDVEYRTGPLVIYFLAQCLM